MLLWYLWLAFTAIASPLADEQRAKRAINRWLESKHLKIWAETNESSEERRRDVRQIGQPRRCNFDCVHGQCDSVLRVCTCEEGWLGAACDVCEPGRLCDWSAVRPHLAMILPQTGIAGGKGADSSKFVYARGRGFTRGWTARYACIFQPIGRNATPMVTVGDWMSEEIVRCQWPFNLHSGRYIFEMAPIRNVSAAMANVPIYEAADLVPYANGISPTLTLYLPCDGSVCEGVCLGAKCLCSDARSGVNCEIPSTIGAVPRSSVALGETENYSATEFLPITVKVSTETSIGAIGVVESDIASSLLIDMFDRTATWLRPLGRTALYSTTFSVDDCCQAASARLRWTLAVKPTYAPTLLAYQLCDERDSRPANERRLRGEILSLRPKSGGKLAIANDIASIAKTITASGARIPLTLRIADVGDPERVRERRSIAVEPRATANTFEYEYTLYPYADGRSMLVTVEHPGIDGLDAFDGLPPTNAMTVGGADDTFEAKPSTETLTLNLSDTTHTLRYSIRRDAASNVTWDCFAGQLTESNIGRPSKWTVVLLEPIGVLELNVINGTSPGNVDIQFRHFSNETTSKLLPNAMVKLLFKCAHNYAVVNQRIKIDAPIVHAASVVTPTHIDETIIDYGDGLLTPPTVHLLDIDPSLGMSVSELLGGDLKPFRLLRNDSVNRRAWLTLDVEALDKMDASNDLDGQLRLTSKSNPVLTVPYRIQKSSSLDDDFALTVTIHCPTSIAASTNTVNVQLYTANMAQNFVKIVRLNSPTVIVGITADIFQVKVTSMEYLPLSRVVELSRNANSLSLDVEHVDSRAQIVIDEDGDVCLRHDAMLPHRCADSRENPPRLGSAPVLYIRPTTFGVTLNDAKRETDLLYADFVFSAEDINAYAMIQSFELNEDALFSVYFEDTVIVQKSLPPICSGCGYRLAFRLKPNASALYSAKPSLLCNIHRITVVYTYILPNISTSHRFNEFRCLGTVDEHCSSTTAGKPSRNAVAQSLMSSADFSSVDLVPSLTFTMQQVSPSLSSTDEFQMTNFPRQLLQFFTQLHRLFPSIELAQLAPAGNTSKVRRFADAIADRSEDGPSVTAKELNHLGNEATLLAKRWNTICDTLMGFNADIASLSDFSELTRLAARLRITTRKFGSDSPFEMLHEILKKLYKNVGMKGTKEERTGSHSDSIGTASIHIEPDQLREGDETQIFIAVHNRQNSEWQDVRLSVDFNGNSDGEEKPLKYRLGPIFYDNNAVDGDSLAPNTTLRLRWIAAPIADYPLTRDVEDAPRVVLSFVHDGRRSVQRLSVPSLRVQPRDSVRVIAIAFPKIDSSASRPFSASIAIINNGLTLSNVILIKLRIQMLGIESPLIPTAGGPMRGTHRQRRSRPSFVNYRIDGVRLGDSVMNDDDLTTVAGKGAWSVGDIAAGTRQHFSLNLSAVDHTEALLANMSIKVLVNGEVPTRFDYRMFFIHETVGEATERFLVSDTRLPYPLYFYDHTTSALMTLSSLELVQEKHVEQEVDGHRFWSVFAVYRMFDEAESQRIDGVYGRLHVPAAGYLGSTPNETRTIVRVAEIVDAPRLLQRSVDPRCVWTRAEPNTVDSSATTVEWYTVQFVDVHRTVGAPKLDKQIFYEFLFGDARFLELPYFTQPKYTIELPAPLDIPPGTSLIVARLRAFSPTRSPLNYTLLSRTKFSPLQIIPDTGEIVWRIPRNGTEENDYDICVSVVASEGGGRRAVVPLTVTVADHAPFTVVCERFSDDKMVLYHHVFGGDRTMLLRLDELRKAQKQQEWEAVEQQQKEKQKEKEDRERKEKEKVEKQQQQQGHVEVQEGQQTEQQQIVQEALKGKLENNSATVTATDTFLSTTVSTTQNSEITVMTATTPTHSTVAERFGGLLSKVTWPSRTTSFIVSMPSSTVITASLAKSDGDRVTVATKLQILDSLTITAIRTTVAASSVPPIRVTTPPPILNTTTTIVLPIVTVATSGLAVRGPDLMLSNGSPATTIKSSTATVDGATTSQPSDWQEYRVVGQPTVSQSDVQFAKLAAPSDGRKTSYVFKNATRSSVPPVSEYWTAGLVVNATRADTQLIDAQSAAASVDMACRQRTQHPIWAVICDMSKTVYRTL